MDQKSRLSRTPATIMIHKWVTVVVFIVLLVLCVVSTRLFEIHIHWQLRSTPRQWNAAATNLKPKESCLPFLPPVLLQNDPPTRAHPAFSIPIFRLEALLRFQQAIIRADSFVVGLIGPSATIWSHGYGRAKANGTDYTPPNEHTIYRIASVSKLFATMEGYVLRDRGIINWDDPVERHLENFTYNPHGWREYIGDKRRGSFTATSDLGPITLRQIASQMSGIGRDLPPYNLDSWPDPPPTPPETKLPTLREQLESIADLPLVAPPYSFPSYSNTGFSILGASLAAADSHNSGTNITYAELLKRDVFIPLGMNGSSFAVTEENREHLAIPKVGFEMDLIFPDSFNAAGGQFSSLSDLSNAIRSILKPSLLSPSSKQEWLRPMHIFPDSLTETGLTWEIFRSTDSHGRELRYYSKSGNLIYSSSVLILNPELQFGIVVLMTGGTGLPIQLGKAMINIVQPVFESILETRARERYAGVWTGTRAVDRIQIEAKDGSLWITKWLVNGRDFLRLYLGPLGTRAALWSTGRLDEFRVAIGRAGPIDDGSFGCFLAWVTFDALQSHHAPIDLFYFEGEGHERRLYFPSANLTLTRA